MKTNWSKCKDVVNSLCRLSSDLWRGTYVPVEMLKGYMLIFRNAERVHGKRKFGNPCVRPCMSREAECGAMLPQGIGWPLERAVATVASACTRLTCAMPEVPGIEVSPGRIRRSSKLKGTCGWSGVHRPIRKSNQCLSWGPGDSQWLLAA